MNCKVASGGRQLLNQLVAENLELREPIDHPLLGR